MNRAARAGELLAHVLMSGAHGDRPVNLVAYSMGARLVYHCLLELCRCRCRGIVQDVIMLGAPVDVLPVWSSPYCKTRSFAYIRVSKPAAGALAHGTLCSRRALC